MIYLALYYKMESVSKGGLYHCFCCACCPCAAAPVLASSGGDLKHKYNEQIMRVSLSGLGEFDDTLALATPS